MSPEILALAAVVGVASAVQGFLGFGYGIIVMTVLTLSGDLVHATAFVNVSALALSGAMVWREYHRILWGQLVRILPPMLIGISVIDYVDPGGHRRLSACTVRNTNSGVSISLKP